MKVVFQGELGANSHLALEKYFRDAEAVPGRTFEDAFNLLKEGEADLAFIPIENSIAGRVADIHHLLPKSGFKIIGEHFEPIHHQFLVVPGTKPEDIKEVYSHVHALGQCRNYIRERGYRPIVHADTAGAAQDVSAWNDKSKAAIASTLAGELYKLELMDSNIEDADHNTTRFLVLSPQGEKWPEVGESVLTSIFFTLRSVPSALYKAIGGFATAGINLTKIESYVTGKNLSVAQFYVDVEGHPDSEAMKHALEELKFFTTDINVLGVYKKSPHRMSSV
jgi:prephenate dehydratase